MSATAVRPPTGNALQHVRRLRARLARLLGNIDQAREAAVALRYASLRSYGALEAHPEIRSAWSWASHRADALAQMLEWAVPAITQGLGRPDDAEAELTDEDIPVEPDEDEDEDDEESQYVRGLVDRCKAHVAAGRPVPADLARELREYLGLPTGGADEPLTVG